ncbi:MAG: dTDP-4-dehydrorhamnose 3,5-epimerase [Bacteroidetes bacterium]|nr:dTDP-4-dehydrorhamnose 3,5-epimerase [Bacteroidota bacterium]
MRAELSSLVDCYIIHDNLIGDDRGYFFESFNRHTFREQTGLDVDFVQDNQSSSQKGVIRGLHFQRGEHAQAKLVRVLQGSVLDVAVDIRKGSPTYGKSFSIELSENNQTQLFIPRGFAHGFEVLSEQAIFFYKCDNFYNKAADAGILYSDPALNIPWQTPASARILSPKDIAQPMLHDIAGDLDFIYTPHP